jgi:hypothetical protein
MKMRGLTARDLFLLWLAISAIWIIVVAFHTWNDIPRDDWVSVPEHNADQLANADDVLRPITGIFGNPIARVIVMDNIGLAFLPPIITLACGASLIWSFREFPRRRK